jgi:hypothetical protein
MIMAPTAQQQAFFETFGYLVLRALADASG